MSTQTFQQPNIGALEVVGFTKRYGSRVAILDAGFCVQPGQVIGIIGPNGAGKTTLLEAIAGILPCEHGEIRWGGQEPHRRRDVIFYLPDGVRPYGDQYVEHVLAFFAGVYRRTARELRETVSAVGLNPMRGQRVRTLSKGFARRLIWAIGLLAPHPVLLMDEPFDGFDLKQTREMMGLLRQVAAGGRSLVLSIHHLRDAEQICDQIVLLDDGRIRGQGTLADLRAKSGLPDATLEDIFLALT
jgi:ABC-type multidrug transport system ATPase subunit